MNRLQNSKFQNEWAIYETMSLLACDGVLSVYVYMHVHMCLCVC